MSRGLGSTERAILDRVASLRPDAGLTVEDLAAHVYGPEPTKPQRNATRRAVHRLEERGLVIVHRQALAERSGCRHPAGQPHAVHERHAVELAAALGVEPVELERYRDPFMPGGSPWLFLADEAAGPWCAWVGPIPVHGLVVSRPLPPAEEEAKARELADEAG